MGSVVIHDFEVLREAKPAAASAAASESGTQAPEPPEPQDVKNALQMLMSQALRVWAH